MALSKSEILLQLYARLKQSPCTIEILTDWKRKNGLEFHDRSLYRYLNELTNNLHIKGESIEVSNNEKNKKTWKLVYDKSQKEFGVFDINTFFLAKHFVPQSIIAHRQKSFDKIEELIYRLQSKDKFEYTADANQLAFSNTNFYDISYTAEQQKVLEELIWAIQNKLKLIVTGLNHFSEIKLSELSIADVLLPIALKFHRGSLHVCEYNESKKKFLIIPFDVFVSFTIADKTFNPTKFKKELQHYFDTHFGISENINDKLYQIELEFSSNTGLFVSQFFWHNSLQFTILTNGNYLFKLNCGINRELVGWIFQWMSNVKVIKPIVLKNMVIKKHQECIDLQLGNRSLAYNNSFRKK